MLAKLAFVPVLIIAVVFSCWVTNLYRLTECDFEGPYKCEVIHAIGLIPPASLVTVWFDTDS